MSVFPSTRYGMIAVAVLCLNATEASAQTPAGEDKERVFVIADAITRTPLRDVNIFTADNQAVKTNWRGEFILSSRNFKRITIGHPKYYSRVMEPQDFRQDTIVMIPKAHTLTEVEVIGHRHGGMLFKQPTKEEMTMAHPQTGGINVLGILAWGVKKLVGKPHKMTQKEKTRQAVENY
ncbi:hypothetical protein [Prevotella sp.]|uniref:hypothetical protein n=1 Tax=Prevotella sp. TaxID=59823 RepID=UPI002F926156